jgi:hypothetical protein
VPTAAGAAYKAKDLLQLSNVKVDNAAFTGVSRAGVHVNAYAGDVTGNGTIDALDVATANSVAQGSATGFAAYGLLDPAVIGDVANDISVDAGDVSTLAAFVAHLPTPRLPAPPAGVMITPVGADPTLSLSGGQRTPSGETVSVLLDHPHPAGSTGLTETILALTYDPSVLGVSSADITLGSLPSLGTGWQIHSVVDAATGQIGIEIFSTTALTGAQAGSLVNIAFHSAGTGRGEVARAAATEVHLVSMVMPNGQQFETQLDDAQGALVISPGMDHALIAPKWQTRSVNKAPRRHGEGDRHTQRLR